MSETTTGLAIVNVRIHGFRAKVVLKAYSIVLLT